MERVWKGVDGIGREGRMCGEERKKTVCEEGSFSLSPYGTPSSPSDTYFGLMKAPLTPGDITALSAQPLGTARNSIVITSRGAVISNGAVQANIAPFVSSESVELILIIIDQMHNVAVLFNTEQLILIIHNLPSRIRVAVCSFTLRFYYLSFLLLNFCFNPSTHFFLLLLSLSLSLFFFFTSSLSLLFFSGWRWFSPHTVECLSCRDTVSQSNTHSHPTLPAVICTS